MIDDCRADIRILEKKVIALEKDISILIDKQVTTEVRITMLEDELQDAVRLLKVQIPLK
jgi:hypothetical protein